ncbi:hypothetical protein DAPPUDRAFT_330580 [Daphnia pulex]|uniref:Uncharacterized protein n=1 Tax=Daphnia pulex TaxID=6669 RepID=E9HK04_DAPPU|nr:hypothetical protein DAPPUDRAFT_330580 [Daphnia pulex]|eukprot:EFX67933.1 hypothetical protein DAPPUDRAFT_330580 [Daphnia pulex]
MSNWHVLEEIRSKFRGLELSDASRSAQIEHLQHNITVKTKKNAHFGGFQKLCVYWCALRRTSISLREAELKNVEEKELRSFLFHQEQISKILTKKQERELVVGSSKIEELMSKISPLDVVA